MVEGLLLACLAAAFFGAYILPRKFSALPTWEYQLWLSLPIPVLVIGLTLALGMGVPTSPLAIALGALCGLLWASGAYVYTIAVDDVGVTRGTAVKNMSPIVVAMYGWLIFGDQSASEPLRLGAVMAGSVAMSFTAVLFGRCTAPETETARAFDAGLDATGRGRFARRGYLLAALAGLLFGSYTVPLRIVIESGVKPLEAMTWMALAIPVCAWLAFTLRRRRPWPEWPGRREVWRALITGAFWVGGGTLGTISMTLIPMGVTWSLTNMSSLVTTAVGVWVYREVRVEKHRAGLALAIVATVAGAILLGLGARRT